MRKGGPVVDQAVIAMLRERVIAHNSQPGADPVKLNALKQIYQRGWRGAEPQARALSKVDEYLGERLAKADPSFDETEHPRDQDGQFADKPGGETPAAPSRGAGTPAAARGGGGRSPPPPPPNPPHSGSPGGGRSPRPPKAPLGLPASPQAHQALMSGNAGYQALQTAVIPESRFETAGHVARYAGSLALGTGLVLGLSRGRANGLTSRTFRLVGGLKGELVGGLGAGIGLRTGNLAARGLRAAVGRSRTAAQEAAAMARINAQTRAAARAGWRVGSGVANGAFRGLSAAQRKLNEITAATAETPLGARYRRAAAMGTVAIPVGLAINHYVEGTPFDPAVIGHGIDTLSSRSVRKIADSNEIGAAHDAMLEALRKGGELGELRKAIGGRLYSGAGRALLTGLGAIGGGAAGAAVAGGGLAAVRGINSLSGGGKTGNPYHDKSGQFTSKEQAHTTTRTLIGGGVAGAVAGGLGAFLALRSHNTGVMTRRALGGLGTYDKLLARINSDSGHGQVSNLTQHRASSVAKEVADKIEKHPQVVAVRQAGEQFGASSPLRYKAAMQADLHNKIADNGAFWDRMQLPTGAKGKEAWQSIGEIKAAVTRTGRGTTREQHAATKIKDFLRTANDDQFAKSIEHLTAQQKTTAKHLWDGQHTAVASVDSQLASHHAAVKAAETQARQLAAAHTSAQAAHSDTTAIHARSPTGTPEAAKTEANMATAAATRDAAKAAHDAAVAAHAQLKTAEPKLVSPITNNPIVPPPVAHDTTLADTRARVQASITRTVDAAYGKKIDAARGLQRRTLIERKNRLMGGLAVMSERYGATAGIGASTAEMAASHRNVLRLMADATRAQAHLSEQTQRLKDVQKILGPKPPAGMGQAEQATLHARRDTIRAGVEDAQTAVDRLHGELAIARDARAALTHPYAAALQTPPATGGFKLLPDQLRQDLEHDLSMASTAVTGVTQRFINHPTSQMFLDYAQTAKDRLTSGVTSAATGMFYSGQPPEFSWRRAMISVPLLATAVTEAGLPLYRWAKDYVSGGDAKFPRQAVDFTHEIDPITGAGYAAISIPHPTDKNDRMVLFGEHGRNFDSPDRRLQAGGRMSAVRQAFQQNKLGQTAMGGAPGSNNAEHTGDAHGMQGDLKKTINDGIDTLRKMPGGSKIVLAQTYPGGPSVGYRAIDDQSQAGNDVSGKFMSFMRDRFLNKGGELDQQNYWHALNAVASQQGQALNPNQAFGMMAGTRDSQKNGVFAASPDWKSNDAGVITAALTNEITRAQGLNPRANDLANLHRAVQKVAVAKKLSAEQTTGLHDLIRGSSTASAGAGATAGTSPPFERQREYPIPPAWKPQELHQLATSSAVPVARAVGANFRGGQDVVAEMTKHFAITVGHTHGLGMPAAVKVAGDAIIEASKRGPGRGERAAFNAEMQAGGWQNNPWFDEILNQEATAYLGSANKLADLNDLDALLEKAFDETRHRRQQKGSDRGGEFTAGGGGGASSGFRKPSGNPAGRTPSAAPPGRVPDYHPLRASQDLAGNAGMQAAWMTAAKFLPGAGAAKAAVIAKTVGAADVGLARTLAAKTLGNLAGGATAVGTGGLKLAAGIAGGAAAVGLAQTALHAAGYKLPGETEKPSLGRDIAGTVGAVAGGLAGGAAGIVSGPGAFAASVGGSWAGQIAGQHLYDWFAPYGAGTTARVAGRFSGRAQV